MQKKEIMIPSDQDGLDLSSLQIMPEGEVKGIVQISHGMAENKERYMDFMEFLAQNGYVSIIHDHRGHGKSVIQKDDLGYFYDTKAEYIVEDLKQVTDYIKEQYPDKPLILFGHSMGSMVVRKYIKKYDKEITKLVICGSPSRNKLVRLALALVRMQKIFHRDHYRSNWIQNLTFSSYNKGMENPTSSNSWICSDTKVVEAYDASDLCGFVFTLNGFQNLFTLSKNIYSKKDWNVENKNLPILFIAGEDDPTILSKEAWIEAQDFLKNLGYANISNKLYPKMRHEILNEVGKETVYQDVQNWIEKGEI